MKITESKKVYNEQEQEARFQLSKMDGYIALSLFPPLGETIIRETGNRMYINEGRKGVFKNISERFYDEMVVKYDSRSNK